MFGLAGVMGGCATHDLWSSGGSEAYSEDVSSVLISRDGKTLVVLGTNYHYIFDAPPVLVRTLRSPFHEAVRATLGRFEIESGGTTTGKLDLWVPSAASAADREAARAAGYTKTDAGRLEFKTELTGKRYFAGNFDLKKSTQQPLNKNYTVEVTVERPMGSTAAKIVLTPVTVTVDGVLLIASIPLLVVTFLNVMDHSYR